MRAYDLIKKKRDGEVLTADEINFMINGYLNGSVKDYQMSALLMAIYYKGMTVDETAELTFAIKNSGRTLNFANVKGTRVDKHSTGGVGDKTSLVVMPIVASLGLKVAKMSGRGLGHTGGTIDKLESISGFNVNLSVDEFEKIVNETGVAIIGQTENLAPADKKLYALRDVTATVDSIPLIASSIMGKKLAASDDVIVLDVKCGSGAFMKTEQESIELAKIMVEIGKKAGKKISALITNMDAPIGCAIGNSLEVIEAINALNGNCDGNFYNLCVSLATEIAYLSNLGDYNYCKKSVIDSVENKSALNTFKKMVAAQGGDASYVDDVSKFKKSKYEYQVKANASGYVYKVNAENYGTSSLILGAGRNKIDDEVDYTAGIIINKKVGDKILQGETIATLYTNNEGALATAERLILNSTEIKNEKPLTRDMIIAKIN